MTMPTFTKRWLPMKLTSIFLFLLLSSPTLHAFQKESNDVWPAWRGPTLNGHAAENATPPIKWSENENVRWKVELPGIGNSTPCVWDNKIILTSAKATGLKDNTSATGEIHQLLAVAYDLDNGEVVWKTDLAQAAPHEKGHATSSYASASAVTDGDKIYAFFGSLGLFALDMEGNKIWDRKFPKMKTAAGFGEGASPALRDNFLVIPWDEEGQSSLIGIDATTGDEIWRTDRDTGSAWSTPLIVDDGEQPIVIVSGSTYTRAYELQSGKEIWHCGGMSQNPTCSPVTDGSVVFIGNTYKGNVFQAIHFENAEGDLTGKSNLLWTHQKSASYVPTPLVIDGKLYFLRNSSGVMSCLDAKTGEVVFPGKRLGLKNVHASPILAANRIYVSSREGDTAVIDHNDDCKILATNHLDDVFDASPIAIGSRLILRGRKNLYCVESKR